MVVMSGRSASMVAKSVKAGMPSTVPERLTVADNSQSGEAASAGTC